MPTALVFGQLIDAFSDEQHTRIGQETKALYVSYSYPRSMWPWAHAAVGYLIYSLFLRVRNGDRHVDSKDVPAERAVLALAVGTQFPDLVDKPLAWYMPILPTGRSLAHSLLVAGVVIALVGWIAQHAGQGEAGTAFGVGYISHSLADGVHAAAHAEWADLSYLAWPVLPSPAYEGPQSVLARLAALNPTPTFLFELVLTAAAIALWARQGYPGLNLLWKRWRAHTAGG